MGQRASSLARIQRRVPIRSSAPFPHRRCVASLARSPVGAARSFFRLRAVGYLAVVPYRPPSLRPGSSICRRAGSRPLATSHPGKHQAASEALFLALLLGSIDLLLSDRIIGSALLLGASGLVRYDGWLYVPLLTGWLVLRRVGLPRIASYVAIAAAPIVFWLWVNGHYTGDALAPLHHIDRDHRWLTDASLAYFGQIRWRGYCLVYWPLAVLLVCTPVLGALPGAAHATSMATRVNTGARRTCQLALASTCIACSSR